MVYTNATQLNNDANRLEHKIVHVEALGYMVFGNAVWGTALLFNSYHNDDVRKLHRQLIELKERLDIVNHSTVTN